MENNNNNNNNDHQDTLKSLNNSISKKRYIAEELKLMADAEAPYTHFAELPLTTKSVWVAAGQILLAEDQ